MPLRRPAGACLLGLVLASPFLLLCLGSSSRSHVGFAGCPVSLRLGPGHAACRGARSGILCRVRERRRSPPGRQPLKPWVLTSKIKNTSSTMEMLALIDKELDGQGFDQIHMSATFTRAAFFKRSRKRLGGDTRSSTWPKLAKKLRAMLEKNMIPPREAANVLWALVEMYRDIGTYMDSTVPILVCCVRDKAGGMKPQELSNSLWAIAKLQEAAPTVLMAVPAIAECIPQKVKSMKPQELSNSLWATAKLHEASPAVLMAVPAIAECIPQKVESMIPQHLSNCLWAAANLQEAAPAVLIAVPAIVERIPQKVEIMNPQELSNCLWATANLQEAVPAVLLAVPAIADRMPQQVESMNPQDLANNLWAAAKLQESAPVLLTAVPSIAEPR